MTFSQFTTHFLANRSRMASSVASVILRDAKARLAQRQTEGRGSSPLLFDDLIGRIEDAVSPRS